MILIDGIEYRTADQWARKHRKVLKRQLDKGVKREWRWFFGMGYATFYREEQTIPFNARELKKARKERRYEDRERKARLSCRCCHDYVGRDIGKNKLCNYCSQKHTAWQWLNYKHMIPNDNAEPVGEHPEWWDGDEWIESEKEWFYYSADQVHHVDGKIFKHLKEKYIEMYDGWDVIDLDHTEYNGKKWW